MYTAPYCFDVSPVERIFGTLKKGNWDIGDKALSKK
jgi:hypothetical protein